MDIVVDSNLLIVLAHPDPRSELAEKQFERWFDEGCKIHAPELARYKIANAFTRLINAGLSSTEQLESIWLFLNNLPIIYHSFLMEVRTIEIALSLHRQSAYDAAYIALAEALNAQLWTLDIRLYRNAVGQGLNVNLLESQT